MTSDVKQIKLCLGVFKKNKIVECLFQKNKYINERPTKIKIHIFEYLF